MNVALQMPYTKEFFILGICLDPKKSYNYLETFAGNRKVPQDFPS